jgi:enterochelin esterase-like enzyme
VGNLVGNGDLYLLSGRKEARCQDLTWVGARDGTNRLASNRRLVSTLWLKDYDVRYDELCTGHDYLFWRDSLAHGLSDVATRGSLSR